MFRYIHTYCVQVYTYILCSGIYIHTIYVHTVFRYIHTYCVQVYTYILCSGIYIHTVFRYIRTYCVQVYTYIGTYVHTVFRCICIFERPCIILLCLYLVQENQKITRTFPFYLSELDYSP